jgi:hypothetical protein
MQQTPTDRPSLQMSLEQRYANQKVGGAFDAKQVKIQPMDFGLQDKLFETPVFSSDNFNDKALNYSDSMGVSTKKYKP